MSTKKEIWDRINTYLKSDISESEFKTWFSNTTLNNLGKNVADIGVPNKFVASWIHENYATKIQKAFEGVLNFSPTRRLSQTLFTPIRTWFIYLSPSLSFSNP